MTKKYFPGNATVPLSPAVQAGDFVFISGQIPAKPDGALELGGITDQTHQVMKNVQAALKMAGCSLDDVVKTTVWLSDSRDFGAFNVAYASHLKEGHYPARTTTQAKLMVDIKVEIEAIAYKPG